MVGRDTDWSKLRFETQKESYSEEGSAPSLFGQNWIFHGDMEAIVKVQELLGGTIVDP